MAKPTATGKPVLVIIETQAGPQPQIWYDDGGRFVGCSHLEPVTHYSLPDPPTEEPWSIAAAVGYLKYSLGDHHAT